MTIKDCTLTLTATASLAMTKLSSHNKCTALQQNTQQRCKTTYRNSKNNTMTIAFTKEVKIYSHEQLKLDQMAGLHRTKTGTMPLTEISQEQCILQNSTAEDKPITRCGCQPWKMQEQLYDTWTYVKNRYDMDKTSSTPSSFWNQWLIQMAPMTTVLNASCQS